MVWWSVEERATEERRGRGALKSNLAMHTVTKSRSGIGCGHVTTVSLGLLRSDEARIDATVLFVCQCCAVVTEWLMCLHYLGTEST